MLQMLCASRYGKAYLFEYMKLDVSSWSMESFHRKCNLKIATGFYSSNCMYVVCSSPFTFYIDWQAYLTLSSFEELHVKFY